MKFTYQEIVDLKNICVKAQQFELAVKLIEEERRKWKRMPKKEKETIRNTTTGEDKKWIQTAPITIRVPVGFTCNVDK